MDEKCPVWKFDRVRIYHLQPIFDKEKKSRAMCHASVDFGFFTILNMGIERMYYYNDRIAWSNDFGWGNFKFNDSQIDNPYMGEVVKLEHMLREELDKKQSVIIDFLDDPCLGHKRLVEDDQDEG